ncbi:MAG: PAS domain S-box protein, partial [Chloroflexi bacterium]|nr:PAS domain S-box protein [Chloroflexota bacterium]
SRLTPLTEGGQGIVAIVRDVTERKEAERALLESEQRFRAIIENAQDAITLISAEGTVLYESPAVERITGYKPGSLKGKSIRDLIHPDDMPAVERNIARIISMPGHVEPMTLRVRRSDGSWRWLEGSGKNSLHDPQIRAIVCTHRDITKRKWAEEALRESEQRFRGIFENANDMIIYLDGTGAVADVNSRGEEMFGYTREEMLGKRFVEFPFLEPHAMWEMIDRFGKVILSKSGSLIAFEAQRRDGSRIYLEASSRPVQFDGGSVGLLAIVRDISERKRAEEELQKAYDEMEQRVEERTAQLVKTNEEMQTEIAERKRIESALRESEERYRLVAENSGAFISVTTLDGIYIYVSPSHRRLGYDPSGMIGTAGMDIVHPDDKERNWPRVRSISVCRRSTTSASLLLTPSGARTPGLFLLC